jgi:hypothetical protein
MPGPTAAPTLPANSMAIFDHRALRRHRARAAGMSTDAGFLFREGAERLLDRISSGPSAAPSTSIRATKR